MLVVPFLLFPREVFMWSVIWPINDSFYSVVCREKIWLNEL